MKLAFRSLSKISPFDGDSIAVGYGVVQRVERFPIKTPLCPWPGLGIQPQYKVPDNIWVGFASKNG